MNTIDLSGDVELIEQAFGCGWRGSLSKYVLGALMVVAWVFCRVCEWLNLDVWDREKDI